MGIKITFLGAAQNVTGSRYLIEANNKRVLVDCGLYQERNFKERDWLAFPVPPASLDAVLLTHAHLDHCGMLPKLVRDGCSCPIYCTAATKELAKIVLMDSAELQMEDAEFKRKRHKQEKRHGIYPEAPLYTTEDVRKCLPLFSTIGYGKSLALDNDIEAVFYDAGHILGSSCILVKVKQGEQERKILFSGDLGRTGSPILRDPTSFEEADYVVVESTYGNRLHENREKAAKEMADIINETDKSGGNIVIPVFAIERAQDVLYYLNKLFREDSIPHLSSFIDSPMATKVTHVFEQHPELFDEEMSGLFSNNQSFFSLSRSYFVETIEASKAINHIKGTVIIMAGSGMCTGGRIKHHLVTNIARKESTILFVGYQAHGTLGRQIVDGEKVVRILGKEYPVKARIAQIDGFSAHADKDELTGWLSAIKNKPRYVFITHGEPASAQEFAKNIEVNFGWRVAVPEYLNTFELD